MSAAATTTSGLAAPIENKIALLDKPYRDKEILDYLYYEKKMSTQEVADKLGVVSRTISNWLKKTGLGVRDANEGKRVQRASFCTLKGGYEQWQARNSDRGVDSVYVHQLQAVADGANPHDVFDDGTHVHHRSKIPWLNIGGGVEVLTHSEHSTLHHNEEWDEEENGIPMLTSGKTEDNQ